MGAPAAVFAARSNAIRVGSQTNAWPIDPKNFESLLAVLKEIKQLGFEGFETGYLNVRSQFANPDAAYDRFRKTGLHLLGVHIFLKTYDEQTAIAPWNLIQPVAVGAKALGAERLILSGGSTVHPLALRAKADALSRTAKYCKGIGLELGYHNHDIEFREHGAQIDELLKQTDPNVHFVIDAGHALEGGADLGSFFTKHWKRIDAIHLRDAKAGTEVPLGQGDYDYAPLAAAIHATGWKGWLVTEEERLSGDKPGAEAVKPARDTIKKVFGV
jgi:sugar phosphate isomerase/epimerase